MCITVNIIKWIYIEVVVKQMSDIFLNIKPNDKDKSNSKAKIYISVLYLKNSLWYNYPTFWSLVESEINRNNNNEIKMYLKGLILPCTHWQLKLYFRWSNTILLQNLFKVKLSGNIMFVVTYFILSNDICVSPRENDACYFTGIHCKNRYV